MLSLAVGKIYRNGWGNIVSISKENDNDIGRARGYMFIAHGGASYSASGKHDVDHTSHDDLVEEVSSPDDYLDYLDMRNRVQAMQLMDRHFGLGVDEAHLLIQQNAVAKKFYDCALSAIVELLHENSKRQI